MDRGYDQQSIVLLMQAKNYIQRDQLTKISEDVLRSGDYIVPYREEKQIVLLPLTRLDCAGSIVERIGKKAEKQRLSLTQLRCSAVGVTRAVAHDDWNTLFNALVPWSEFARTGTRG